MTAPRVRALIDGLPPGVSELYLHPATMDDWPGHAPGYAYVDELAALVDPGTRAAVVRRNVRLARFADLGGRERGGSA